MSDFAAGDMTRATRPQIVLPSGNELGYLRLCMERECDRHFKKWGPMLRNKEFRYLVWTTAFVVVTTAYFLLALLLGAEAQLSLGLTLTLTLLFCCAIGGWVLVSRSFLAGRVACMLLIVTTLGLFVRAGFAGVTFLSVLFFLLILLICFRLLAAIRALNAKA